jgi:CRISPR-associated protein Csx10
VVLEIALTLELHAPVALHRTRTGVQFVETLDYIPGTALRGALAEAYLAEKGTVDNSFRKLFISDQVQYGDLWPALDGKQTTLLPATAQGCKRYGLKHRASFRDSLLDVWSSSDDTKTCPECGGSLDRVSGYLCGLNPVEPLSARSRLRVSTAIERSTGTIAREMLFTRYTLTAQRLSEDKASLLFQGKVLLFNPTLKDELVRLLNANTTLFLGAGRSRGLGQVEVKFWSEAPATEPLAERYQQFNAVAQRAGGEAGKRYFSLTLLSHLALRDDLLRPVLGEITPQHFGLPDGVAWVRYPDSDQPVLFLSAITVPGWNAALGLPKPDTVALARGSVLLGQCDAGQEQAALGCLAQIEAKGVGERRNEGFGRVAVCYPIHYTCWR